MTHNMIFFYGQIPVYNAFSELLERPKISKKLFNHGGPSRDNKLSETPSY